MLITAMPMPNPAHSLPRFVDALTDIAEGGSESIWLPQLPAMPGIAGWDPLIVLALLGQRAPAVKLGTAVSVIYGQHPFTLARQALAASAAVGGRLTLGLGLSHPPVVEALGYRYDKPAAFMDEYLTALLPALAGVAVDVHGEFITAIGQVEARDAPVPSVVLAALGPRMLRIAGSRTDGTVTSWVGPRTLDAHIVPLLTKAAAAAGRPAPRVVAGLPVVVTDCPDDARAVIDEEFAATGSLPAYRAMFEREGVTGPGDVSLVGDEAEVEAQLRRLVEVGVTEFVGTPLGDAASQARTLEFLAAARTH
ncbi:TIGR03564 family F420-dependent LLM class oxidoreductase [Mycobacterium sp. AZCC_0083]|uniref:TIGR03564 family F420-dependent LLM class oxidoreductase n=1 Tax=Mycobacterium sp. AZCC_0083 TaxID=2735882 RepID=UPI0016210079|nr:TIGR03564 family F420-dependent LLM class oxidoreductase [Mycobacterium sp. AZCC_0083]MBB5163123.1 F420-dependent oxidoreductase-like protein [Mycobacterium sp. AZCC_0083]